ncbi:MAG: ribonuclease P protein component [Candidatus Dormibacteraeota bacterium]|nr:ribonuclease P protein component [Candidatus Dormibacteraeota bacterium]
MKKRSRLTARTDFQRLLTGRRLYAGANLVGFATAGRAERSRVGVSTSRQIQGAVARNRARRRVREAVRLRLLSDGLMGRGSGITFDVVLIARPPALTAPFAQIEAEIREFGDRLDRIDLKAT